MFRSGQVGFSLAGGLLVVIAATVAMAWLFTTGFLVNSAGELTFDGPGLSRLGLLAVAALAGGGYAVFHRAPVAQRRESTSVPSAQHDHAGDMTVSHHAQMAHLR